YPRKGGQECPASGLFPDPLDVGNETRQHQNINAARAVSLEREMDAIAPDVPRRRWVLECWPRIVVQQRARLGFRCYVELLAKTLRQGAELALGGGPISCEQKIADEVPVVYFAERIELNKPASVGGRGSILSSGIPVVHQALECLDRPPS